MKKLKQLIVLLIILIAKIFLGFIYFFMKLLPIDNKIVMLSRQYNKKSIDFELMQKEIKNRNDTIKIQILCNTLKPNIIEFIKYGIFTLKSMYHIATSKICIVDGYSIPISLLNHRKELNIIQIWHASGAIKKFGYQILDQEEGRNSKIAKAMRMHFNYNYVVAPSEKTAEFYQEAFNIEQNKIIINGLPRLDYILGNSDSDKKQKQFYEQYPEYKEKPIILYVPTFRKNTENIKAVQNVIENVDFSKYNLIIKLHQLDKSMPLNKYVVDKKYNTFDLLRIADYIITDYSAVAFEASILDKPIYFYVYDIEDYKKTRGLNIDLSEEIKNNTSSNIKEIMMYIENKSYDYNSLKKFKTKYMGDDYYNNTSKLVDFVLKHIDKDIENEENSNEFSKEKLNV